MGTKAIFHAFIMLTLTFGMGLSAQPIDRYALMMRNNPHVSRFDSLASLSVGNGEFAFTADATGLQTFPEHYSKGVPLGTQSQWGWHSFDNTEGLKPEQTLKSFDFGRGHEEPYACQFKEDGVQKRASEYFRMNPHRLHLGIIGFEFDGKAEIEDISIKDNWLDLWQGVIHSCFTYKGEEYSVQTVCHPKLDMVSVMVESRRAAPLKLRFPYPTGGHCDDACDWTANDKHTTSIVSSGKNSAVLKRTLGETTYYIMLSWEGKARLTQKAAHYFVFTPQKGNFSLSCRYSLCNDGIQLPTFAATKEASAKSWRDFWTKGAAVDFSRCKDPRAKELERRVVLSQYLLAIQSAGSTPPQETGLTYNSWFGKFHLEMIWWHQSWLPLWNHGDKLEHTLAWYSRAEPMARQIAHRQGFKGVRWMKMTDPSATEAPSNVGSFLIWQQPHLIYLAELLYRSKPSQELITKYNRLIQETADFMYSFATYDTVRNRYVLKGLIPAQETLRADETVNPPFELSYWHFAMQTAQKWRERAGQQRKADWDKLISQLSPLAFNSDSLYLAAETALDTYTDIRFTSDHMAVLGAVGILPMSRLVEPQIMRNTLSWIWDYWNWNKTWGWDYPMTAMCAARLGEPDKAVTALLMNKRTNTYLPNGHNYQDGRLRVYLPGNGGLLTAIAMMCAGWNGSEGTNPGFPKDGKWDVRWEGLNPLP